ncbi:hypothetical protein Tco_0285801 [Tanacetum coccineum]
MKSIKKSIAERAHHQRQYDRRVNEIQMQRQEGEVDRVKALDVDLVVTKSSRTERENHDTSSKSGNDTHAVDAYIKPVNDKEPMVEVDSNTTPNSTNMSNRGGEIDQNAEKCQVTSPLLDPLTQPNTRAKSYQSLERHFKTLRLDELRSPDFNLLSDQEYSEEEEAEAMAETMEQYMSKTRTDYGSGVARPKIEEKDSFELKGQFLKELRENTFSGSDNEDANESIKKVLEIVDLFHVPNFTVDQLMLRVFHISLTGVASRWLRNKPTGSMKTWEDLKTKFLNKYCPPSRTTKKIEEINNFQQEPDETLYQACERFKELLMKYPQYYLTEMQKIQIRPNEQVTTKNEDLESLPRFNPKTTSRVQVKSISTTIKADSYPICCTGSPQYAASTGQNGKLVYMSRQMTVPFPSHLDNHYCEEEEEGIYGPKFTEAYGASHINHTIPQKGKGKKSQEISTLLEDYIGLNDLNEPIEIKRNQGDDLMHTIKEGEVIEEFRTRDEDLDTGIDDYPSYCDDDKKIHINCAYYLRGPKYIRIAKIEEWLARGTLGAWMELRREAKAKGLT